MTSELVSLIKGISLKDPEEPPKTTPGKPKRYNTVPPPDWKKEKSTQNAKGRRRSSKAHHPQQSPVSLVPKIKQLVSSTETSSLSQTEHHRTPYKSKAPRSTTALHPSTSPSWPLLYIMKFEPYGDIEHRDMVLGVYANLEAATTAVAALGIEEPSRAGLNGVMDFVVPGGKLKVIPQDLQGSRGDETKVPENGDLRAPSGQPKAKSSDSRSSFKGLGTSSIQETKKKQDGTQTTTPATPSRTPTRPIFLALDAASSGIFIIGSFTSKPDAWAACVKYRTQLSYPSYTDIVKEKSEWVDKTGMPHSKGKIEGGGWHHWLVEPWTLMM